VPNVVNPGALRIEATSQSLAHGSARHAFYQTADAKHVFVAMIEPKFWAKFCEGVGRPDLAEGLQTDVQAFDPLDAAENAVLRRELTALFKTRTRDEWTTFFLDNDLPNSPVNTTDELTRDPQFVSRGTFVTVDHPVSGPFTMADEPIRVQGANRVTHRPAPAPGQHADAVLSEIGYSTERVGQLRQDNVVA
jgi:crotonobetainyl-CoA:carnitine CoA-transferase CaiB-like acyl-CoA transferase